MPHAAALALVDDDLAVRIVVPMEHGFFFHRIIAGAIRNIMRRKGWPFPAQGGRPKGDLEQIETKLSERGGKRKGKGTRPKAGAVQSEG